MTIPAAKASKFTELTHISEVPAEARCTGQAEYRRADSSIMRERGIPNQRGSWIGSFNSMDTYQRHWAAELDQGRSAILREGKVGILKS
jgi:hypothetical protein